MWKLLLQAGVGFATFDVGRKVARFKRTVAFLAVAGVVALFGAGALVAAAIIALTPYWGPLWSAAAVGGGLLAVAGVVAFIGTRTPRARPQPTPIVDRVRSELGAAGSAIAAARSRTSSAVSEPAAAKLPRTPRQRKKRALNLVLIATLAGVVLGRRL